MPSLERTIRPYGAMVGARTRSVAFRSGRVSDAIRSYNIAACPATNSRSAHMGGRFSRGGRVAVSTGGGTGIGRGAALVLAEHGADVVLAGRRPDPLESTANEGTAMGRRARAE